VKLRLLIVAAILLLFVAPVVMADYPDNFDYYTPTTTFIPPNPSPWSFTYTPANSNCFFGEVVQTQSAKSLPNVYEIQKSGSCYSQSSTATLSIAINVSSPFVYLSWVQSIQSGGVPSTGVATLSINANGSSAQTYDLHSLTSVWSSAQTAFSLLVGKVYTLSFVISDSGYTTSYAYSFAIDNVVIKGANAIINPHDFVMYDYSTHQLFNISDYAGSYIAITYPDSPQVVYPAGGAPLNIPEAELNFGGASLVTVWVSTSYYRTLLVPSSVQYGSKVLKMFLSNPHFTVAYEIQVLDLSGYFNSTSTQVILSQGNVNISSGYLDSSFNYPVWLVPGTYNVTLYNPVSDAIYHTNINTGQVAATITVSVPNLILATKCSSLICSVNNHKVIWSADLKSIDWSYSDASGTTTKLVTELLYTNASGTFVLQSQTDTNSPGYGSVSGSFSCYSDACNTTLATQLSVEWLVTNEAGVNIPLGPVPVVISQLPGGTPSFGSFGGLDFLLPGISVLSILALVIIIVTSGIFVIETAPLGFVVAAGELVFFGSLNWIPNPLGGTVYGAIFVVALIALIRQRELRSQYP
jgi:hypothetical protein